MTRRPEPDPASDVREQRDRGSRARDALESAGVEAPHAPRRHVGRVVSVPPGAVAPVYVDTHPVAISGDETSGTAATRTVDATRTVPVLILGAVPTAGQDVVARTVQGGRWAAYLPGGAQGPPFCPLTIRLLDCDGSGIEGATVTATGGGPDPLVGTTDSTGSYTFPSPGGFGAGFGTGTPSFTIEYDGVTGGPFFDLTYNAYNCTHTLDFCYRHARITVTTTGAASPSVDPGTVFPFAVSGNGTGTIVLTYKAIQFCFIPSLLPEALTIEVGPADPAAYLDNCTTLTVDCGDDLAVSLPLFEWDADYAVHIFGCDEGCAARGEGPLFRGLAPKDLFVTISPDTPGCGVWLGVYAGVEIPVVWDGTKWDSGCLAAPLVPCTASPYGLYYQSARLVILPPGMRGLTASPTFDISFRLYGRSDCTDSVGDTCQFAPTISTGTFCLTSPVDVDLPGTIDGQAVFCNFTFHVRE